MISVNRRLSPTARRRSDGPASASLNVRPGARAPGLSAAAHTAERACPRLLCTCHVGAVYSLRAALGVDEEHYQDSWFILIEEDLLPPGPWPRVSLPSSGVHPTRPTTEFFSVSHLYFSSIFFLSNPCTDNPALALFFESQSVRNFHTNWVRVVFLFLLYLMLFLLPIVVQTWFFK